MRVPVGTWSLAATEILATMAKEAMSSASSPLRIVRGACGHDCPDTCWLGRERAGRARPEAVGDPAHPFTRGTLCAKVNHYLERVYHPDRVLHPLKRVGAKGEARFVRVSWDEALADIARALAGDRPRVGGRSDPAVLLGRRAGAGAEGVD